MNFDEISPDERAPSHQGRAGAEVPRDPDDIESKRTLVVAMADPLNVNGIEDLRFHTGMFIKPVLAAQSQISRRSSAAYHIDSSVNEVIQSIISNEDDIVVSAVDDTEERQAIDELMKEAEGRPIVRLTNWLLHRAVEARASDIHIEPQNNDLIVRLRVDGLLREEQRLPKWTQGRDRLAHQGAREPRHRGEAPAAGRTPRRRDRRPPRGHARLDAAHHERREGRHARRGPVARARRFRFDRFHRARSHAPEEVPVAPAGHHPVTGPTGSGKSTLLYAALRHLQHVTRNITTVEDPVEYQIPGINQVHVDEKAKKTFAGALRAILRQDPDIIMIGEIRDKETAQIAFRASVTGHLVLSTVHMNDAAGAVAPHRPRARAVSWSRRRSSAS